VLDLEYIAYSDGNTDTNQSNNDSIHEIIETRYSRRAALFGGSCSADAAKARPLRLTRCKSRRAMSQRRPVGL
jgi:hypothetical protein